MEPEVVGRGPGASSQRMGPLTSHVVAQLLKSRSMTHAPTCPGPCIFLEGKVLSDTYQSKLHVVVACEDQSGCELLDLEFTRHRSLPTYIFLQLLITKPFSLALLQVPCGQKTGLGLRVPSQCWWTLRE